MWKGGEPENLKKNPQNKARTNNKLNPHLTPGRIRMPATLMADERSLWFRIQHEKAKKKIFTSEKAGDYADNITSGTCVFYNIQPYMC